VNLWNQLYDLIPFFLCEFCRERQNTMKDYLFALENLKEGNKCATKLYLHLLHAMKNEYI
jgi:hypothetical protein